MIHRMILAATIGLTLASCSPSPAARAPDVARVAAEPVALTPPRTPFEALDGIDMGDLNDRERNEWWRIVSEALAPCSDQAVTIAGCVKEQRPCAACAPAAQLVVQKIREGLVGPEAEAALAARFGAAVKTVALRDAPVRGPASAPVTIVVWSDFQCPHCRLTLPLLESAFEALAPDVRLVHKLYPLPAHTHADAAARASVAAKNQGKYWEMEKILFDHQQALEPADLEGYARNLELDMKRFRDDMQGEQATKTIAQDKEDAQALGLSGTPFILINGREFDLRYFRIDRELEPWVKLEIDLARRTVSP